MKRADVSLRRCVPCLRTVISSFDRYSMTSKCIICLVKVSSLPSLRCLKRTRRASIAQVQDLREQYNYYGIRGLPTHVDSISRLLLMLCFSTLNLTPMFHVPPVFPYHHTLACCLEIRTTIPCVALQSCGYQYRVELEPKDRITAI